MAAALSTEDDMKDHASAVMVVLDIFPEMMRTMIVNIWPPKLVLNNVTPLQKKMILKLESNGYNVLDISCLYKIIRNFNLLPCPKQGWGQKPKPEDISEGDDVERMTRHRNDIIHRPRGGLAESERKYFFQESIDIAKLLDRTIGSPKNGFESRIQEIRSYSVTRQQYNEAIVKCAEYQEKLQEISTTTSFDLYYGEDIKIKTNNKELRDDSSTACTLYVKDPDFDVNAIIRMLDKIKDNLYKGLYGISLEGAEIGSLNLHVTIHNGCFNTKKILHKSVQSFLQHFFEIAQIRCMIMHIYTVVLAESDVIAEENMLAKRYDLDNFKDKQSPVLKLNVNVKKSVFEDDLKLYREVGRFITGMYNAVDRHNVPVNGSAREVLMLTNEEHAISSSEANQDPQLSLSKTKRSDKTSSVSSSPVGSIPSYKATKSWELRKNVRELTKEDKNQFPMEQTTGPSKNMDAWLKGINSSQKQIFNKYDRAKGYSNMHQPLYKPSTSIAKMTTRDTKIGDNTSTSLNISSMNIYESFHKSSSSTLYPADIKSEYRKHSPGQFDSKTFNRQGSVKKTNILPYDILPPIEKQEIEPEVHGLTRRFKRDQYSPQNPQRRDVPKLNYLPSLEQSHDKNFPSLRPQSSADLGVVYANQFKENNKMSQPDRESDLRYQPKRVSTKTDSRYNTLYKSHQDPANSLKSKAESGWNQDIKYPKSSVLEITGESMFTYSKSRNPRYGHKYFSAPVMRKITFNVYAEHERRSKSFRDGSGISRPCSDYIINSVK